MFQLWGGHSWPQPAFSRLLAALLLISTAIHPQEKQKPEPRLTSVDPVSGTVGQTYTAVIRGRSLNGAHAIDITGEGVRARILNEEAESVKVEITSESTARPGAHSLRVRTAAGITNEATLLLSPAPVFREKDVPQTVAAFPIAIAGKISERGEVDRFWFDVKAGQTLTFQAKAGSSLDPSLALFQRSPTWLDADHLEQIAFNDEPLFFPGFSTDAHLVHTFAKAGRYCVKVLSSTGQGSADAVYELRMAEGVEPAPAPRPKLNRNGWDERLFTRELSQQRQTRMAKRGGSSDPVEGIETYQAVSIGSKETLPVMRLPGLVQGQIARPAEAHRIKFRIEKAENIAVEIETPQATMPVFNPVILLFEPGGREVATNVYTKRNNNGLYMMKMIHPKVTVSLHAPGDYEMEIRDITTDRAGADFRYRVLVRRQSPHIGNIEVAEDHINLRPGSTREVNITVDREEGFTGLVAFTAEGVPPGVTVMAAAPKPVDKPPLPNGGKLERYNPVAQNSALVFIAAPDAAPNSASKVRIVARPVVNGKIGEPIIVKEVPLMIISEKLT